MRKIILLILLLSASFMFISCGDTQNNDIAGGGDNNPADPGVSQTIPGEQEEENTPVKLLPDIPAADYGGYDFTILVSVNGELAILNDFEAEEETGDVVNDAIYRRNRYVEGKYNINILNIEMDENHAMDRPQAQRMIRNAIAAGENSYDAAMISGYGAAALTQGGFLRDLNDMDPIDLTKPWWDQMANRDLMVRNRMFYTTGAISNVVNRATYAILFSKQMIQDFGLEDPYALVESGKWTYDKLIEMATNVTHDLNGDGFICWEDRAGALIWDDTMMGIINSIGERCAAINSKGEVELTLYNERTLRVFDTYIDFALSDNAITYQNPDKDGNRDWESIRSDAMFGNNQALFFLQIMELVVRLRAMEIDFGVLPYPKFDTAQENYYSTVGSWHSGFICVPAFQDDPLRTGAILEAMAAESMYTLLPAYYDIALKGKMVRDEESEEMLDLIFATKVFDLGWIYQIGSYNEDIMNQLRNRRRDFTSMYERGTGRAERVIERINEVFDEIAN